MKSKELSCVYGLHFNSEHCYYNVHNGNSTVLTIKLLDIFFGGGGSKAFF